MSFTTWTPTAVSSEARIWSAVAWRIVESQHIAATMKLVDTRDEQDLLEALLESGKPPLGPDLAALDYLLASPFRYSPLRGGSRFRGSADPGVFYGAESVRTAGAELGYWRWRFLQDAVDLERLDPIAHTAFSVTLCTKAVDLRLPPFDMDRSVWRHPNDYAGTQAFARIARHANVGAIVYSSVRDSERGWCVALLDAGGFAQAKPHSGMQTWYLAVSRQSVTWRREAAAMTFSAANWVTQRSALNEARRNPQPG